jgi:PAS domain S-box-containing protein
MVTKQQARRDPAEELKGRDFSSPSVHVNELGWDFQHQRTAWNGHSGNIILILSPDHRILEFNQEAERVFGVTRREVLGCDYFELFLPPEVRPLIAADIEKVLRGEPTVGYENAVISRNGSRRQMLWNVCRLTMGNDEPIGIVAVGQDITDRRRSERALREAVGLLDMIYASAPIGLGFVDREFRFVRINEALCEIDGSSVADHLGRTVAEVVPALWRQLEPYYRKALLGETVTNLEVSGETSKAPGQHRHWLVSYFPVRDQGTDVLGIGIIVNEVTEHKQAEADIQFLLDLSERVRKADDAVRLLDAVTADLGRHLRASRCFFVEGKADDEDFTIERDYHADCESVAGCYSMREFGTQVDQEAKSGRTIVVIDVSRDSRTLAYVENYRHVGVSAYVSAPLLRDGGLVSTLTVGSPVPRDWAPREVALVETVAERTWLTVEKLRLDAALRDSEERFRALVAATAQIVWTTNAAGDVVEDSPTWNAFTGQEFDQFQGEGWLAAYHPDDHERILFNWRRALTENCPLDAEYRLLRADGEYRWTSVRAVPLWNTDGAIRGWVGMNVDITANKQAEEALRRLNAELEDRVVERTAELNESRERLADILSTASDAIITIDRDGRIESANTATERMFRYSAKELIGQSIGLFMPSIGRDDQVGPWIRRQPTGPEYALEANREVQLQRRDGSRFPASLSISEVRHLGIFTLILHDLTRRKELEREVLEIASLEQQSIGQELHDGVGQELTGLSMMADALLKNLGQQSSDQIVLAAKVAAGLERIHQQVRDLSRGLIPVSIDPEGLGAALEDLAARTNEQTGIACTWVGSTSIRMEDSVTASHLFRIAQEAIANALRHGDAQHVTISLAEQHDGQLALTIRDDGAGIDDLLDNTKGLGIHLMRNRASLIGGQLTIERGHDGGTVVTCRFPHADPVGRHRQRDQNDFTTFQTEVAR